MFFFLSSFNQPEKDSLTKAHTQTHTHTQPFVRFDWEPERHVYCCPTAYAALDVVRTTKFFWTG